MPRPFPLQCLLDLAQRRLDAAAVDLGRLLARGADAEERLRLLLQFRDEYHARFSAAARGGLDHAAWRNYSEFLGQLDTAVTAQRAALDEARAHAATGRSQLQAAKRSARSYEVLAQRHNEAQLAHERRREQKDSDERAAMKPAQKRVFAN